MLVKLKNPKTKTQALTTTELKQYLLHLFKTKGKCNKNSTPKHPARQASGKHKHPQCTPWLMVPCPTNLLWQVPLWTDRVGGSRERAGAYEGNSGFCSNFLLRGRAALDLSQTGLILKHIVSSVVDKSLGIRCKAQLLNQQDPTWHSPPGSSISQWHFCAGHMLTAGERASKHSPCLQSSCCPLSQASHVTSLIPPLCGCHLGGRRRRSAWFRQQCDAPSSQASLPLSFPAGSVHSSKGYHKSGSCSFSMCPYMQTVHTEIYFIHGHAQHSCAHHLAICF